MLVNPVFSGLYFSIVALNADIYRLNQIQGNKDKKKLGIWTLFSKRHYPEYYIKLITFLLYLLY